MTKTAAIIGGGVIGGGWTARFLLNGWDVNVYDPDPNCKRKISEILANARYALPMLYDVAMPAEGNLNYCASVKATVTGVAWIQESIPERLDVKHSAICEIEKFAPAKAIIGSSTSGFKPSELQVGAKTPERILVTHPFNPVYLLPVVEVVPSPKTNEATVSRASDILTEIGMYPLRVRKEIDAHIADRFLEAVWREALWLIKDGIATTQEIDDVIRYGFGLRWAQMGLFETYRIAGGEAGMRHFIEQFGPCLSWPWTKLMDVPELTDELADLIAHQSDGQSGQYTIRELERLRDDNLVAMMRALKGRDAAAGSILNAHQVTMSTANPSGNTPLVSVQRVIPSDWTDYNDHMNESRYGQVFSDAADEVMRLIGADGDYVASGFSYFTVDIHIQFLQETKAGQPIHVETQVLQGEGKKLNLFHEMKDADGKVLATSEQLLIHVDLEKRRSCDPNGVVLEHLHRLAAEHGKLPNPAEGGEC